MDRLLTPIKATFYSVHSKSQIQEPIYLLPNTEYSVIPQHKMGFEEILVVNNPNSEHQKLEHAIISYEKRNHITASPGLCKGSILFRQIPVDKIGETKVEIKQPSSFILGSTMFRLLPEENKIMSTYLLGEIKQTEIPINFDTLKSFLFEKNYGDTRISRDHATLSKHIKGPKKRVAYFIQDNGSLNGTFLEINSKSEYVGLGSKHSKLLIDEERYFVFIEVCCQSIQEQLKHVLEYCFSLMAPIEQSPLVTYLQGNEFSVSVPEKILSNYDIKSVSLEIMHKLPYPILSKSIQNSDESLKLLVNKKYLEQALEKFVFEKYFYERWPQAKINLSMVAEEYLEKLSISHVRIVFFIEACWRIFSCQKHIVTVSFPFPDKLLLANTYTKTFRETIESSTKDLEEEEKSLIKSSASTVHNLKGIHSPYSNKYSRSIFCYPPENQMQASTIFFGYF